jgi:hypothetical protein
MVWISWHASVASEYTYSIDLLCATIRNESLFQSVFQTDRGAPGADVAVHGGKRQDHLPLPLRATQPGARGKRRQMDMCTHTYIHIYLYICTHIYIYIYIYLDISIYAYKTTYRHFYVKYDQEQRYIYE